MGLSFARVLRDDARMSAPDDSPLEPRPGPLLWSGLAVACIIAFLSAALQLLAILSPGGVPSIAILLGLCALMAMFVGVFILHRAVARRRAEFACFAAAMFTLIAAGALYALLGHVLTDFANRTHFDLTFWLTVGPICFVVALASIAYAVAFRRWGKLLERYKLSSSFCPQCGYDLRGTIAARIPRCPECGTPIAHHATPSSTE
jgi:hypothetical protein